MEVHDVADYGERRGGRPTDYKPEFCKVAAELAEGGATDVEIAQALDIHPVTLWRWYARHPEFRKAVQIGKECADDRVEMSMYHRANGYTFPAVKIMQDKGTPIAVRYLEHVPPDPGCIMNWLTNRRGDRWKSKQSLEHSGPGGGPIQYKSTLEFVDAAPREPAPVSQ